MSNNEGLLIHSSNPEGWGGLGMVARNDGEVGFDN